MAEILADKDIKRLLGTCIINGQEDSVKPNSYDLSIGGKVRFKLTNEEVELKPKEWVEFGTGETIDLVSLERIDFRKETVEKIFPGCMLMGMISTKTTLMREGISQVSTKIDAGFEGILDWSIRNNYHKSSKLQYGEKVFNLVIFKLKENEIPDIPYGSNNKESYQGSDGLTPSIRKIPVHIPEHSIKKANRKQIDYKQQLKECGPPISYVGEELVKLDEKVDALSNEVVDLDRNIKTLPQNFVDKLSELEKRVETNLKSLVNEKLVVLVTIIIGTMFSLAGLTARLRENPSSGIWIIIVGIAIIIFGVFSGKIINSRK